MPTCGDADLRRSRPAAKRAHAKPATVMSATTTAGTREAGHGVRRTREAGHGDAGHDVSRIVRSARGQDPPTGPPVLSGSDHDRHERPGPTEEPASPARPG